MNQGSRARRCAGAVTLLAAMCALLVLLPSGAPAQVGKQQFTLGSWQLVEYIQPQPACSGVGYDKRVLARSDCGFGRVTVSPAAAGKTVNVDFVDGDGTVVDTQAVTTDASGVAQFDVIPNGTWDPGTITIKATVASPDSGTASIEFELNPLETTPQASASTYAPGDPVVVTGTVEELDTVACCNERRTAVPAHVTATLADADGNALGQPVSATAASDGTYTVSFPGSATQGLHGTPESDFLVNLGVSVRADYTDATPFVGFGVPPTAQTSGRWSGTGTGAVVVRTPPSTLLVRNLFVSSVGWVKPGQSYPFRIVVENHTDHAFTNARVTIPSPDGATFVGATPLAGAGTASATSSTVTWTIPSVPAATDAGPTTRTLVVDATAKSLSADRKVVWKDLSSTASLTYDGAASTLTSKSHGPKVIPPAGGFETARYGDKPFPVVPVDYRDREHEARHSGDALERKINSPDVAGSTYNLYQEMSYGQLFPYADVPSAGIATAGFDYTPGFDFSQPVLVRPDNTPGTCRGTTLGGPNTKSLWGSALYPERIKDGWYQLPGDTEYYGGDWPAFTATSAPPGQLDSACGPVGKGVYDAAQIADPEIDYNQFDSDKDGVVDFFMMVFVGLGGNGDSQVNGTPPYDNIWPHSSSLEYYFHDPVTGLPGYTSDDQLTDLSGRPQCWRDTSYAEHATCGAGGNPSLPTYVRVGPYNVNPENAIDFASVISHEYGHHLGLPDYYSTSYSAYNDWNLMAGDYSQHMTVFSKQDLGWVVPQFLQPGDSVSVSNWKEIKNDTGRIDWKTPTGESYTLSAANGNQGVHNGQVYGLKLPGRVVLPASAVPSGQYTWWSERGNDFGCSPEGGHNLDIALPGLESLAPGTPVKLTFKSRWDMEWDFDYGFTLVTTNGSDYTSLPSAKGYTTSMAQNPNSSSCLTRLDNGLTGTSASAAAGTQALDRVRGTYAKDEPFVDDEYDLTSYAGQSGVVVRLSYSTDPGLDRPGWFIDDLKVATGTGQVVYGSSFEEPDDLSQFPGGCGPGNVRTADRCTAGWSRIQGGSRSAQDHGYYLELRDRSGFDFASHGEADRGAIQWSPGVLVEYTDEVRGYGNNGGGMPPRQHYLDSQPQPGFDCGDNLYETDPEPGALTDPRCEDAAFTAASGDNHFRDVGWVDNFKDDSSADGLWHFDFDCLTLDVTRMTGDTGNSAALPSDLTADARITAGQGCAPYDYGRGQIGNTPPAAAAEAKPTTVTVGQAVTLDGSGSSDDRQAPEELTYAWDTDGNGSDDKTGQVVTQTYANAGQYTVRLRVTDADGASDTATAVVTVKAAPPDLQVTGMTTSTPKPKQGDKVTVVVTVKNTGAGPAAASSTKLEDGGTAIGVLDTPALAPGASTDVRFTWDLHGVKGDQTLRATADSANVLAESSETNNVGTLAVTVKGNKVKNGSFEQPSSTGSAPDGWTGQSTPAGQATWSDGGSDGSKSASTTGSGGNAALLGPPTWTSDPIAVSPGEALDLSVAVRVVGASSTPSVGLAYLGAGGELVRTVTALTAPLSTSGFQDLATTLTVPAGVAQVRVVLVGFSLLDPAARGTVTFDDVRLCAH